MKIYKKDSENAYNTFLQVDSKTEGCRRTILSALPLYTATDELIDKILRKNNILNEEKIKEYVINQRKMIDKIKK